MGYLSPENKKKTCQVVIAGTAAAYAPLTNQPVRRYASHSFVVY